MHKLFFIVLLTSLSVQTLFSQGFIYAKNEKDHFEKVTEWRKQKDIDYRDKEKTMLTEDLMKNFNGLKYYDIDYAYRINGSLKRFNDGRTFKINTTGGQVYEYLIFGQVTFELKGQTMTLDIYQGKRAAESGRKKGALFIPFRDLTSGNDTYGGGRYLVLDVPDNDVLVLDFNMAYNPYCVYNPDHSCPIPPKENNLKVKIEAGELMYP
jgi:uncharacterized protein